MIHDKPKFKCSLSKCEEQEGSTVTRTSNVVLEPYLHWGTLTPATDLLLAPGMILAFRRNRELSKDPLWTQAIKELIPKEPAAYCIECLEALVQNRLEAWTVINMTVNAAEEQFIIYPIQRQVLGHCSNMSHQSRPPLTHAHMSFNYPAILDTPADAQASPLTFGSYDNAVKVRIICRLDPFSSVLLTMTVCACNYHKITNAH